MYDVDIDKVDARSEVEWNIWTAGVLTGYVTYAQVFYCVCWYFFLTLTDLSIVRHGFDGGAIIVSDYCTVFVPYAGGRASLQVSRLKI